jgi:hypothetical protein
MRRDFHRPMNNSLVRLNQVIITTDRMKNIIFPIFLHIFTKLSFIEQMQSTLLPTNTEGRLRFSIHTIHNLFRILHELPTIRPVLSR